MALPNRDVALSGLLDLMFESDAPISVTILVHGVLLSGIPIPEDEFYKQLATLFPQTPSDSENKGATWSDVFRQFSEGASEGSQKRRRDREQILETLQPGEDIAPETLEDLTMVSICLKDVTFLNAGSLARSVSAPLWRGRLSEVDGWTLGRIKPDDPS